VLFSLVDGNVEYHPISTLRPSTSENGTCPPTPSSLSLQHPTSTPPFPHPSPCTLFSLPPRPSFPPPFPLPFSHTPIRRATLFPLILITVALPVDQCTTFPPCATGTGATMPLFSCAARRAGKERSVCVGVKEKGAMVVKDVIVIRVGSVLEKA
jgi:hypothetical protein